MTDHFRRVDEQEEEQKDDDAEMHQEAADEGQQQQAPYPPAAWQWWGDHAVMNDPGGEETDTTSRDKLSGFLRETMKSINQEEATKSIENGFCWKRHPDFVPRMERLNQANVDVFWKKFYPYDIFTWRPDIMHPGWTPNCVTCFKNDRVGINDHKRDPRLIYGLKKNCILNSPLQWICRRCLQVAKAEKDSGVHKDDCSQYTFSSHHPAVLSQIEHKYPGTYQLFPFYLGHRSGIDKEVAEIMFHSSEKGMGPAGLPHYYPQQEPHQYYPPPPLPPPYYQQGIQPDRKRTRRPQVCQACQTPGCTAFKGGKQCTKGA
jgi:hypothetical protein